MDFRLKDIVKLSVILTFTLPPNYKLVVIFLYNFFK